MTFEEEYLTLIENSFFIHEHKVRFVITKVNSIIRSVNKDVVLYEYNDYCREVYKDVKEFTSGLQEIFSEKKITAIEQLDMLFDNLVKKQVDKKIGDNGFHNWFINNKQIMYETPVDYFRKEYF